jgi:predicted acyltransferase
MILVDDAGGVYPRIDHSPWNGCTLADFVIPFFLFIVGVAIALALKVTSLPFDYIFLLLIVSFNFLCLQSSVSEQNNQRLVTI